MALSQWEKDDSLALFDPELSHKVINLKITIMGTSNFHNHNASKVFAFDGEEEWDYDNFIESVLE